MLSKIQDINPRVDIAFKKIFGVEENKDLLISLVNSIVSADDQVALAMLKANLPIDSIVAMTGLSAELIAQIKGNL